MQTLKVTLAAGLLLVGGSALAGESLVGKWVEVDGSRQGAKAGTGVHANHVGDRYATDADLQFTLVVEQQKDRSFHAKWCSQARCEDAVGVIRRDGKNLLIADEDGTYTGTLTGDTLELCYTQSGQEFRVAACRDMVKE